MLAVRCVSQSKEDPLSGLSIEEIADPEPPQGWVAVNIRSAALNHHDLWSIKGVGLRSDQLPMTLGTDAAGVLDDGSEVLIYPVIADPDAGGGDETLDPGRTLFSEKHQGLFSERVIVPERNIVPKPANMSWETAACLPTAWLTAYRMLTTRSGLSGPAKVLIQGAGGGVATAAIELAKALGHTVFVTSRDEERARRALDLGADACFSSGEKLPTKVDLVIETVGAATWDHSLRSLRPGGRIVVSGATSGPNPPSDLNRVFFLQLSVVGSTMGTRDELDALLRFVADAGLEPRVDSVVSLRDARSHFERMNSGEVFGKLVLSV
ncbi:MAG: zinc-binding dehydrogenase [Microthrixaceae bacterium]|nr:zinc-binding dehydrogenase [Microthrixaceae bacterium]